MKIKYIVSLFFLCISYSYAEKPNNLEEVQLLKDPSFELGYWVVSPQKDIYTDRAEIEGIHPFKEGTSDPVWRLVQWGSHHSLAGVPAEKRGNKTLSWQYAQKNLVYKSITLGEDGHIELMLNGLAEFSSLFYQDKKSLYLKSLEHKWPHLLLAQNISSKRLNKYTKINLSLDARLLFDKKNQQEGYQHGLHAARFPIALSVRNTLSNNIFWLILVIYDDRFPQSNFNCQKCIAGISGMDECKAAQALTDKGRWQCPFDGSRWSAKSEKKGTRKMLFRVPTSAFTQSNIHLGEWSHYEINLLPYIQAGIEAARQTKNLSGFSNDLRFYDLSFFSMGWEITGLNQAAIAVKNLSLVGESIAEKPLN